jgi:hypothetical protein
MIKMDQTRAAKKFFESTAKDKRKVGRPKLT